MTKPSSKPPLQAPEQTPPSAPVPTAASARMIALAGLVALGVAMGIGRFAFTPILPMMLHDGVVDLAGASWLASANYLGYMVGAVFCTLQPWLWARLRHPPLVAFSALVRMGLVATGVLTLAMAWHAPAIWPVLRFAAGVASAIVFVYTSGWCLSQLALRGVPTMGGVIYAGPGAGIVLSGLLASGMVALQWSATTAWVILGVLAFMLSAWVWRILQGGHERLLVLPPSQPSREGEVRRASLAKAGPGRWEMPWFAFAYSLAGFGYIITATFLPVIARAALPGSAWLDLFWPIFGVGVTVGVLLATRLKHGGDLRVRLGVCYVIQALGVAASLWSPSLAGFAIGSLMLGLPFTAITFFAMQEVRRLRPEAAASYIGLLTATYGVGQIVGPPLVAFLLKRTASAEAGFTLSLEIAATALLVGALLYAALVRIYPIREPLN